jgi:hypothetical protein
MSTPRCPVCGGSRVTPPTTLSVPLQQHMALVYETNPQGGVFSRGKIVGSPAAGCACLDCGYVMVFLKPDDLARLRDAAATLHPTA